MRIGLVHGRFQPLHRGHKWLIRKMLEECYLGVVLIGSVGKKDDRNPWSFKERVEMLNMVYSPNKRYYIGGNLDLKDECSDEWETMLSSCVLSLTGHLPTHIYVGDDYTLQWKHAEIIRHERFEGISSTKIRQEVE